MIAIQGAFDRRLDNSLRALSARQLRAVNGGIKRAPLDGSEASRALLQRTYGSLRQDHPPLRVFSEKTLEVIDRLIFRDR